MNGSPVSTATEGGEVCPSIKTPKDLSIADKILSVRSTVRKSSPVRRTPAFNWSGRTEESEEEIENKQEEQTEDGKETDQKDPLEQDVTEKKRISRTIPQQIQRVNHGSQL